MNIKEIQNLIKFISKSGVDEVTIEKDDFKITIKSSGEFNKSNVKNEIPVSLSSPDSKEDQIDDTFVETTKQVHQSRLTGTRLSDNCNELAFANGQVDAIKGADLCVTPSVDALYVLQMQQGF